MEIAAVVGTSDTTAVVFWPPPSQPNGVITGYQIIYSAYGDSTITMNWTVTENEDSFVITNLSELILPVYVIFLCIVLPNRHKILIRTLGTLYCLLKDDWYTFMVANA